MKSAKTKKIVSVAMAVQLSVGTMLTGIAAAAEGEAPSAPQLGVPYDTDGIYNVSVPHIIINQVYGGGLKRADDTYATNGFIELYNPTDEDVDLNGWSIQYADPGSDYKTGATGSWSMLKLTGVIKAKSSYLVVAHPTGAAAPTLDLMGRGDQQWDQYINNKGLKVVLMSNQTPLDNSLKNPFAAEPKPAGYVDMLGTGSNDPGSKIDGYETASPSGSAEGTSKKKAVRRTSFQDTDNNKQDFEQIDYEKPAPDKLATYEPHDGEDGVWLSIVTPSLPSGYVNQTYEAVMETVGGYGSYTYEADGLPEGLSITSGGIISGTPTAEASNVKVTVTATDAEDSSIQVTKSFDLNISRAAIQSFKDTLNITKIAEYAVGTTNPDGGVAEIVKYNKENQKFYLVNGSANPPSLDIVSLDTDNGQLEKEKSVPVKQLSETGGFTFGDLTSVVVDYATKRVYAAVQAADPAVKGKILALDYEGDLKASYTAGVQPDMITTTSDGRYVLTADEAEPRTGVLEEDAPGSVTIVDTQTGESTQVYFDQTSVIAQDVHIRGQVVDGVYTGQGSPEEAFKDFEPEYIAVSSDNKSAYVTLQENNAIAKIDIPSRSVVSVGSLGYKDFSKPENALDLQADGIINFETAPFYGAYMPDGVAYYSVNGEHYLLTANEGDATEWPAEDPILTNIAKIKDLKGGLDPASDAYNFLKNTTKYDSDEGLTDRGNDSIYLLGGRSFSVWNADSLKQVYDSGSDFEVITGERDAEHFNVSNDDNEMDARSKKKGPEPEGIETGVVGNHTFAFIGLERTSGIMTYDVTDPEQPVFANYTNSRKFEDKDGRLNLDTFSGPEGIDFIPAAESPTGLPLLLVAYEVGGRVGVYQLDVTKVTLNTSSLPLTEGGRTAQLHAVVEPADEEGSTAVTWSSSDTAVAAVDADGKVRPIKAGTAVITAISADGYGSGEAQVVVTAKPEDSDHTPSQPSTPSTPAEPENPGAAPGDSPAFTDVQGHWAADAINKLASAGILTGMPDGTFKPDQLMTRAEYSAVLFRVLGLGSGKETSAFNDIAPDAWYHNYIDALAQEGIISGFEDGSFRPDQPITREEAFVLLYRAVKDKLPAANGSAPGFAFTDSDSISAWAREAVQALYAAGVVQGNADGKLYPKQSTTRAEIAQIAAAFIQQ
ncbi:choice-of-anchor I family protein [Paenibacillus protaetiae]|uniref:Uncharacterized protein n=1 Tax=Paenibacillus protaetiae TaxID=2509456 RepID=A0A4P6ETC5_9BACL|nr:choice-of-anchor I family protein [Paenibacillus protaetiae]QAY65876.1 hypothetical protein ET464_05245 [Paenibacillus protaetiae]